MNREIRRIVSLPELHDQFSVLAIELASGTPGDLDSLVKKGTLRWAEVIRIANVTLHTY